MVGDPAGPAVFHFDTEIASNDNECFTFDLYYPIAGWVTAATVSGGGTGTFTLRLGDNVGEYPTGWRFVPPSIGVTFAGGAVLEMLQSGTTV